MLTLLVAVKLFQIIYCRIGWQLTSDEGWDTELVNSRLELMNRSLISWKDWFWLAGKVKLNHWWKRWGSTWLWLNRHNTCHHK